MGIVSSFLFGNKKKEPKEHPLYPTLPSGIRLNGLIEFKPSCQSYFLLNESKMAVKVPDVDKCVVNAISSFRLFDIDIQRAYLDAHNPETILQFHCTGGEILDCILFNQTNKIILDSRESRLEWDKIIGFKDITTPTGFAYDREWMADLSEYGDFVTPLRFEEKYFTEQTTYVPVMNRAMLYSRILEGGNPEDIEYLLVSLRTGIERERVEIWVGTVINISQLNII